MTCTRSHEFVNIQLLSYAKRHTNSESEEKNGTSKNTHTEIEYGLKTIIIIIKISFVKFNAMLVNINSKKKGY